MVQDEARQSDGLLRRLICKIQHLVDGVLVAQGAAHPLGHPNHKGICVGFLCLVPVVALDGRDHCVFFPVRAGEKLLQGGDVLQPLVGIHGQIPYAGAPVQHCIPGVGKAAGPGKVKEDVGVPLRHRPGAVGRAGVRNDYLTGDGLAQGFQRLQAPLQTANFIFYDQSNGQKRLLRHGKYRPFLMVDLADTEGRPPAAGRSSPSAGEKKGGRFVGTGPG